MKGILPDKQYFKIGEVSRLVGVEPYVLRYWETEFPAIKPTKSPSRQRLYRRRDVEAILTIKHLLYERRFTIEGARKHLNRSRNSNESKKSEALELNQSADAHRILLQSLSEQLREISDTLNEGSVDPLKKAWAALEKARSRTKGKAHAPGAAVAVSVAKTTA